MTEIGDFRFQNSLNHDKITISLNFLFCWVKYVPSCLLSKSPNFFKRKRNLFMRIIVQKSHLNGKCTTVVIVQLNFKPVKWRCLAHLTVFQIKVQKKKPFRGAKLNRKIFFHKQKFLLNIY